MFDALAESIYYIAEQIPYSEAVGTVRAKIESSYPGAKTEIVASNHKLSNFLFVTFTSSQQLTEFLLKWGT
jgi:hypothetical protein